jgi:hypothetical protein
MSGLNGKNNISFLGFVWRITLTEITDLVILAKEESLKPNQCRDSSQAQNDKPSKSHILTKTLFVENYFRFVELNLVVVTKNLSLFLINTKRGT